MEIHGTKRKEGCSERWFACTLGYWITLIILASRPTKVGGLPCKIDAVAQLVQCAKVTP